MACPAEGRCGIHIVDAPVIDDARGLDAIPHFWDAGKEIEERVCVLEVRVDARRCLVKVFIAIPLAISIDGACIQDELDRVRRDFALLQD